MRELDEKHVNTALAALRFAQDSMEEGSKAFQNMIHFSDTEAPTNESIDEVCETINSESVFVGTSKSLQANWMSGREQGIWEVIAKVARENKKLAISLAREMEVTTTNIHEFDWENFTEIFGSKEAFLKARNGE